MTYLTKNPIVSSDKIRVIHLGPAGEGTTYLYGDVLEELSYYAGQKDAYGLLVGHAYKKVDKPLAENAADSKTVDNKVLESSFFAEYPPGMIVPDVAEVPDFVEISAFKDIYPVDDALEYAARLRRMRDFRNGTEEFPAGLVRLSKAASELSFEDLMVQRTYFASPGQILLLVSGDRKPPRAFVMDKQHDHFVECGLEIVLPKDAEPPFAVDEPSAES
ncbi:MAG: hypothetical protein IJU23_01775 [Proteobacteria bacterium]|nr:hypothetical protein [Pseudomonadota bacterium]